MDTIANSKALGQEGHSGTVTFLFTDIEGSTKLLEQLCEQYAILLDEQRTILRAAFKRWNGSEIDTEGDSFFAVFPRAIDAVCCVMEAQRELNSHKWPQGSVVRLRMGLHTGEPIRVRTGYVGMDVHRAARIASAGYGGQVLLSQTTRDLIYQDLPKGTSLRDLGQHKLKDIRFPQQIYQLEIEGLPAEFPVLKTLSMDEEPPTPGEAPYKGLQYFSEADAEWFFGREQASRHLTQALQEQRFLAIIGASGSGKSSVVRAGLVPALKSSQPGHWQVHIFTPSSNPLESLAVSLTGNEPSVTATATLIDDMGQDSRSLHLSVQRSIPQHSPIELLIVVDQFEELFTQCRDEAERRSFVDNLLYATGAEDGHIRVVITLRADFYQHLAQYAGLRTEVAKHQEYLGAMEATELRQAIEEPARRGGWEFSPGLVELILHDIGASEGHQPEPGALPLLSHALLETWKRRRSNLMSLRAYSEAGGVRGAIAKTAESVYYDKLTPEQQLIARNIFLRLTELGEGTQDTRRCISTRELIPPSPAPDSEAVQEVLYTLADARLITTHEDTVEVAHEALIREWPLLREWLTEDREGLRLHRHLTEAVLEWEHMEHDPGVLYRGAHLAQALEWAQINPGKLNAQEQAFLDDSQTASEREAKDRENQRQRELLAAQKLAETEKQRAEEQAHSASRLRRRALYLTIAMLLAGLLAVAAVFFGQQSNSNAQVARQNEATAQFESQHAGNEALQRATQQAIAENEAHTRATAEANALQQSDLASSRELAAAAVSNLQVDPQRSILLALEALKKSDTIEAQNALHQAILASRLINTISAGSQSLFGVAVSPDGAEFATAGMDGKLKVWSMSNLNTLSDASPLLTVDNPVDFDPSSEAGGSTLAFSPDGKQIAVIAANQNTNIYDATNGQLLQTLSAQNGNIHSVAFDPNGKRLVTTSFGGVAVIWDALNGTQLLTITVPDQSFYDAIFTPDGKVLITGGDYGAQFWDLAVNPGKELFSISLAIPDDFAFSPDGKYLAVAAATTAKVWDFQALMADPSVNPLFTLSGHQTNINSLVYSQDGAYLVTGSADGTAKVWDAAAGQEMFTLAGGTGTINSLAISPDGIHPLSAHSDGKVRVWDISTTGSHEMWAVYPVFRATFSLDGKKFVTAYYSGDTGVIFQQFNVSPTGVTETHTIKEDTGSQVSAFGFSADLSRYATIDLNMMLDIWEPASGKLLQSFPISQTSASSGHTTVVRRIAFSPDGARCATASDDGTAIVWDLSTGKPLMTLAGHEGAVYGITYSSDGNLIATASLDGTARIWDASTGEILHTLSGDNSSFVNLQFSRDGKRLVAVGSTPMVWDVMTGKELLTLKGHNATVLYTDFSPDGTRIATSSADGTTIVWDASTGQAMLELPGNFGVKFASDGKSLMTIQMIGGIEGVARGFYLDLQDLITLAHSRVARSLTTDECQKYLHVDKCPASP